MSSKDPIQSFLVEAYSSISTILFTCEKHFLRVILFDACWCPHYNADTYFIARLSDHWFDSLKNCHKCYGKSLKELQTEVLSWFLHIMKINFKKFSPLAKMPFRETPSSTGFDLHTTHDVYCFPRSCQKVETDIGFEIPRRYFGKIHARSSFAQTFAGIGGGVINSDYRGKVYVIFFNFSKSSMSFKKGERFLQIIFQKILDEVKF